MAEGRRLKFLIVIVEHSRLCLAIRLGRLPGVNYVGGRFASMDCYALCLTPGNTTVSSATASS
jgi:hypothetical protein